MEIDISAFFKTAAPRDYSASVAEIGQDAGRVTWAAALEDAPGFDFLSTEEAREEWRGFVISSGGWTAEEVAAFTNAELSALFLQWVAADCREMFPDARTLDGLTPDDWARAEEMAEAGQAPGRIFRADDGRVFFYVGV